MQRTRFHLTSLMLALLMAFTAVHMGYIRGQAPAVGQITLCTGMGPLTVAIDADGNPTGTHSCPECALHLLGAVALWQPLIRTPTARTMARATPIQTIGTAQAAPSAQARGPPVLA